MSTLCDTQLASAKTAITRKTVSAPLRWLLGKDLIKGESCNWGEGKAWLDTEAMEERTGYAIGYDPNSTRPWHRIMFSDERFDTVYCGYVLNTLDARTASNVIEQVKSHLKPDGIAYFAVRTDFPNGEPYLDGVVTQRGTFQMSYYYYTTTNQTYNWIHKNSKFAIFTIRRDS